jgi:23S rRNA pseudouridine1911/1915/1917 synthase
MVLLYPVDISPYSTVHIDKWFIVVNKKVGLPVQPDKSGDRSLMEIVEDQFKALHVVHRIDRPASGLVAFARNAKSAAALSQLFATRQVRRVYWAIVEREPPETSGTMSHRIVANARTNRAHAVAATETRGKPAQASYRLIGRSERYWLLEIELVTGRHHQVRAQLAALGSPIRGDIKYGARRTIPGSGIDLHGRRLVFTHPFTGQTCDCTAPWPDDTLWNAITLDIKA